MEELKGGMKQLGVVSYNSGRAVFVRILFYEVGFGS